MAVGFKFIDHEVVWKPTVGADGKPSLTAHLRHVPAVVVSADAMPADIERAMDAGTALRKFREKPCDLVIVEGYKRDSHDKIEVRNLALDHPALWRRPRRLLPAA